MTKEQRIREFNERAQLMFIVDSYSNVANEYVIELYNDKIEPLEIDACVKELTEAKEIMEADDAE